MVTINRETEEKLSEIHSYLYGLYYHLDLMTEPKLTLELQESLDNAMISIKESVGFIRQLNILKRTLKDTGL